MRKLWPCLVGGPLAAALAWIMPWSTTTTALIAACKAVGAVFGVLLSLPITLLTLNPKVTMFVALSVAMSAGCVLFKTRKEADPFEEKASVIASCFLILAIIVSAGMGIRNHGMNRNRVLLLGQPGPVSQATRYFDGLSKDQIEILAKQTGSLKTRWDEDTIIVLGSAAANLSEDDRWRVARLAAHWSRHDGSRLATYPTCRRIQQAYQASDRSVQQHYVLTIEGRRVPVEPSPTMCTLWGFNDMKLSIR